jgi:hypothetical protein
MKILSLMALAAAIVGVASACTVRTETAYRPAPVTYVATAPAPVVYYY